MRKFPKAVMAGSFYMLISFGAQSDMGDTAAGLRSLMTPEQYKAAGLGKLSAAERDALYQWLRQYAGKPAAQLEATPAATLPTAAASTAQPVAITTVSKNPQQPAATSQASNESQAAAVAREKDFGLPDPPDEAKATYQLHASVQEPFRGWSGKTVFYLDNGQIWKQRTSGRHTYTGDDNRVVIGQNRMGFYEMRLIAVDRSIGVKRLK